MIRSIRTVVGHACVAALLAGVVAVHVSAAPAPAAAPAARRLDGIPPSLDSMPRHPWPRDTSWRDTVGRDTVGRDSVRRDSVGRDSVARDTLGHGARPDSSHRRPPMKPRRPLR